jgi:hypothetical protein
VQPIEGPDVSLTAAQDSAGIDLSIAPVTPNEPPATSVVEDPREPDSPGPMTYSTPADTLFAAVRSVIEQLLRVPMKDAEVAAALDVSTAQAKAWLQRLVDEGVIEKQKKPAGYIVKQSSLFE